MKKNYFIARLLIFWIFFFTLFRLAFVIAYRNEIPAGYFTETLFAFAIGLRMDISAACYLVAIPFMLYSLAIICLRYLPKFSTNAVDVIYPLLSVYHLTLIMFCTLVSLVNICIYRYLGALLDVKFLNYIKYPKETLASFHLPVIVGIIAIWIISSFLFYMIYLKMIGIPFRKRLYGERITGNTIPIIALAWLAVIIVGMRGGIQLTPMNESMTYYSSDQINDAAAANGIWMLGFSWLNSAGDKNPYAVFPELQAKKIKQTMMEKGADKFPQILNTTRPNIIVVMLESWTADVVKALGGLPNVTPCFDNLRHKGLLFTNAYASGSRTDHGLVSILSGFPAQPNHSIITQPDKARKLPFITTALHQLGYRISFYYGGDANFANMKMYLLNAHFAQIKDGYYFNTNDCNGKWGANDAFVYQKQLFDLISEPQPFFSLIMTLSSHEPFEVPSHHIFAGKTEESEKFQNAIYYSDSCLGAYLSDAEKQPWFNNTLFILVADHGHRLPMLRDAYSPEAHRIAMLFFGGALKNEFRGREITKTCEQCDIAAILYDQMQLPDTSFKWSKDVLNPEVKGFACYANDLQAGIISGNQHLTYLLSDGAVTSYSPGAISADTLQNCARAWLQLYYQRYLDY